MGGGTQLIIFEIQKPLQEKRMKNYSYTSTSDSLVKQKKKYH